MKSSRQLFQTTLAATVLCIATFHRAQAADENYVPLNQGWRIQSAALAKSDGKDISATGFDAAAWHSATVPSTILAALVKDGVYTNIYFGTNLSNIPTNQFQTSWWYRNEFELSAGQATEDGDLIFEGINFRANVWLNGQRIADSEKTFGAFRVFKLPVGGKLKAGKNSVAVEVFPPQTGDFTIGFVDWNPKPPDHNMGLFRPAKLHLYKAVAVENLFVESKIDHDTWKKADLIIHADMSNHSDKPVAAVIKGEIDSVTFQECVTLQPRESRSLSFTPEQHPELKFGDAHLWWPWDMGQPFLYTLKLSADVGGDIVDAQQIRFGIREVRDYFTEQGYRGYMVNGKKVLIRGGGWGDNLLLDEDPQKLAAQIEYTRQLNLNTIRMEGIWGSSQRIYDLADQAGLLLMVGWSCQWEWEDYLGKKCDDNFGGIQTEADMELATDYLRDQVLWLRQHPSIFVWVLGSDMLPKPELEKRYDALLAKIDGSRPSLKSCGSKTSAISGPSGVKMNGPYDYVTPNYWYLDHKNGGAFGFNTETGPGPQPPPLESLKKMFPADKLWPINEFWDFHCGRNEFNKLTRYLNAYNQRYGEANSIEEFAFKAQAANYEAIRAMYESFAVNRPETTGIIQWMLNASWPKLYWQLFDYNLEPGGVFFGAKKGAAPVAVIYNYGNNSVYAVNQGEEALNNAKINITAYDLNSNKILEQTVSATCGTGTSTKVFSLAGLKSLTPVYFLELNLQDSSGRTWARNFYWLSTKPDVLDEGKTEWFVTPNKSFADFTALNKLPEASVAATVDFQYLENRTTRAMVTLTNESDHLAFFLEMRIVGGKSQETLLPVYWDDNYVSLPPRASRSYVASLPPSTRREKPGLRLQGWNVKAETISAAR